MDPATRDLLTEYDERMQAMEVLISGLIAFIVRHRVLPDTYFTDDLLEAEASHTARGAHEARLGVWRSAREMAEEEIRLRDEAER